MNDDRDPAVPDDGSPFVGGPVELRARLRELDTFDRLRWLTEGDPLGLVARVQVHLYSGAWLLDVQQVTIRAASWIADRGVEETECETLDELASKGLGAVIRPLLEEEAELARSAQPVTEPFEVRYQVLRSMLEIDPSQFRWACVAFHDLPEPERRATYAFFSGEGFTLHAETTGIRAAEARDLMVTGLMRIQERIEAEEGRDE